jgi:L-aspartate oxidase
VSGTTSFHDRIRVPVLVLGSGISGLATVFSLARRGLPVLVVTKADDPADCNTAWAQGGIIYFGKSDSAESLVRDILRAGAGLCNPEAVRHLAAEGPRIVRKILLEEVGVPFSRTRGGDLDFTREGAHSVARIVHAADATGLAIETALLEKVRREKGVTLWTGARAIDLITARHHSTEVSRRYALEDPCLGAYVLDAKGKVHTVLADFTVLATGGVGRLFVHTTNTVHAIGDGLAMADRAGAATMNLEYVQFHPTTLYHPDAERFLISESLRGEGAVLVNRAGEAFMRRYDRRGGLAPRDVVTRAIVEEMTTRGDVCVYLDLAHHYRGRGKLAIRERFPTIAATCARYGIDIATEPIPVVPAAHYFCGGVLSDLEGRTTIRQLYAVGETSCTGVHGANRLASTSLLEGLVWGTHAARSIAERLRKGETLPRSLFSAIPDWKSPGDALNEDPALLAQDWATIRSTMWNYVGIVRTKARLARAVADLRDLEKRILRFYQVTKVSKAIVDLFHGVRAASLIAQSAFKNPVSRGCHYRKS